MALGYNLGQIARIVKGTLSGDASIPIDTIVTDSRERRPDALFVALRGDRFDGHDFASRAVVDGGARAVLVHKQIDGLLCPYILVADTLKALQMLGAAKRQAFLGPVAAITGSSGKTTTRRLLHGILSQRFKALQPTKNFNNHIGVPLTLLELGAPYEAAVLEVGCSDFGEIAPLTRLCDPDVGMVTNVGPAHLEKLGDLDGVAREKGELFNAMRKDATAVVNTDDPRVAKMATPEGRRVTFGTASAADVRLTGRAFLGLAGQRLQLEIGGESISVELEMLGAHNAKNATAAAAAASAVGMRVDEIARGLASVRPESGRLTPVSTQSGVNVIDDTYNANPASMKAALEALRECAGNGRTVAVLGDMLELGPQANAAHSEVGRIAASLKVDVLVAVGEKARLYVHGAVSGGMDPAACAAVPTSEDGALVAAGYARPGDWVLVKGSRGMKMETVVAGLMKGNE